MALAEFFNRAAQSLQQVLLLSNNEQLEKKLNDVSIAISFNDQAVRNENSKLILGLSVNLISRLYPFFSIIYIGDDEKGIFFREELISIAKKINPKVEVLEKGQTDLFTASICLAEPLTNSQKNIHACADSWNLEIQIDRPIQFLKDKDYEFNPFSSAAAACFAVSEVFNHIFSEFLTHTDKTEGYILSLVDYSQTISPKLKLQPVHFHDLVLVGLGAVGNAIVWCLEKHPQITGTINLVDHEEIDLTNLQRYILSSFENVGDVKVNLAKTRLKKDGLSVNEFNMKFGDYVATQRPNCDFEVIGVAVDNAEDRISTQAVLPKVIFNAWTGADGALGVSHHLFDGPQACLACLYLDTNPQLSYTEQIAKALRIEAQLAAEMLVNKAPLTNEFLSIIATNMMCPLEQLIPWQSKTLDEFYVEAICGGAILKLDDNGKDTLVPLAHQSALAGVFLAAEIIKKASNLITDDAPAEARINVLSKLPDYICQNRGKTVQPQCICLDEDYLTVYREKHCK